MPTLLIATLLVAPPWVTNLNLQPPPAKKITLAGTDVPSDAVPMPPKKRVSFTVTLEQPGEVTVVAWGVMKKAGRRYTNPGKLTLRVGKGPRRTLELSGEPLADTSVLLRKTWRIGYASQLKLKVDAGTHEITIAPSRKAALGYILHVTAPGASSAPDTAVAAAPDATTDTPSEVPEAAEVTAEVPADGAEAGVAATSVPEVTGEPSLEATPTPEAAAPAEPTPALEVAPSSPEDDLPALLGAPMEAEPDLVASPTAGPTTQPGMQIAGNAAERLVNGPSGVQTFRHISIDDGLKLSATGPGSVVLDLHAHRAAAEPSSLDPLVVGLLLDDVLVQTVSLDQAASDRFSTEGAAFELSKRVSLRVSIPLGEHRLQLSLSDNAVLGASVRARFAGLGDPEEPTLLDVDAAREGDLVVRAPAEEVRGGAHFGVLFGTWLPSSLSAPGGGLTVDANLDLPTLTRGLGVGLSVGVGRVDTSRAIADPRKPDGQGRFRLTMTSLPLLADARWSMALPVEGMGLTFGLGGGAVLAWTTTRSYLGVIESGLRVAAAGTVHGGISYDLGPGDILFRAALIAGSPWSAENIRDFDPGAVTVSLGYGLGVGGDE